MDPSKSSNVVANQSDIPVPKRSFSVEFLVGIFTIVGVGAMAYLAMGLGDLRLGSSNRYPVYAEFDNISGLQYGASVEIAGVPVGEVSDIRLKDSTAIVTLSLDKHIKLRDDDIASIRTKGIIGDRYLKISRGSSELFVKEGGTLSETESVVDIEDIIGKFVHSLGGDKEEETEKDAASPAKTEEQPAKPAS